MVSEAATVPEALEQSPAPAPSFEGIAILGSHPATVGMAPFEHPGWLIWACSPHNFEKRQLPRFDEWFETHIPLADATRQYNYLRFLESVPKVWMRDKEAMHNFPGAVEYPQDEIEQRFGPFNRTSSIALMMMKAIIQCEEMHAAGQMPDPKIGLFGIMQASPNEFTYQRPTIQALAWEACKKERELLGRPRIRMIAPDISKLWDPPPEGW